MQKNYLALLFVCLVSVGLAFLALRLNRDSEPNSSSSGRNNDSVVPNASGNQDPVAPQTGSIDSNSGTDAASATKSEDPASHASPAPQGQAVGETPADKPKVYVEHFDTPEQKVLQEFMDDNDETGMLKQAVKMAESKDPRDRRAAIGAFGWVGGAESALSLILLTADEDPEVAQEAQEVLEEVMDEIEEMAPEDEPLVWRDAILQTTTDGGRDALFHALSTQDQTTSIPIYLDFLESDDPDLKERATEYLEYVTHGEKITSRAQAEAWLEKYVKEGGAIFSDDIKQKETEN